MSVDPDLAETGQPYAYAGDDPVNEGDPSGKSPTSPCPEGPTTVTLDDAIGPVPPPGTHATVPPRPTCNQGTCTPLSPGDGVDLAAGQDYNYDSPLGVDIWLFWDDQPQYGFIRVRLQLTNAIDFWFDEATETGAIWTLNEQWMPMTAEHPDEAWDYQFHYNLNPAAYRGGLNPSGVRSAPGIFEAGDQVWMMDDIDVHGFWGHEWYIIWGAINLVGPTKVVI